MFKYFIFFILFVAVFSCKKKEDPAVIEDPNIIGSWKRVSKGVVNGSDTTYTNYSETIIHKFMENNNYEEIKYDESGYSSVAHYTFNYSSDTLRFFSMGALSHKNFIKLSVHTMIMHVPPDPATNVYILVKQ
jgi:hypothetical protein